MGPNQSAGDTEKQLAGFFACREKKSSQFFGQDNDCRGTKTWYSLASVMTSYSHNAL